jgi:hypothetical protein
MSRLRSWCGLFVSVYHDRIYFLHQTAREFLLAERLSANAIQRELVWHGFTSMEDAHTALAECCVRFLSFFANGNSLTKDQGLDVEYDVFLEYSAMIWNLHIRESRICVNEDAAIAPITLSCLTQRPKCIDYGGKYTRRYITQRVETSVQA